MDIKKTLRAILFNRKLFYGILLTFFVFVVSFLVFVQCYHPSKYPKVEDIIHQKSYNTTVVFPVYLHLADPFSDKEIKIMEHGLAEWKKATKGIFDIRLVNGWAPPIPFDAVFYEYYETKTLWRKDADNLEMAFLFVKHGFFDGCVKGNLMVIVDDKYDDDVLCTIMKHEIGHMVGLGHLKEQYKGVMHIGGNNGVITKFDLIMFCSLYNCVPGTIESF